MWVWCSKTELRRIYIHVYVGGLEELLVIAPTAAARFKIMSPWVMMTYL